MKIFCKTTTFCLLLFMTKEYPDIQLLKRYRPISNSLPMIELLPSPDVIKNMISILKIGYLGAD